MTNTKTTKRALLASILSLVICLSMLASTTFAWFTDSASTGVGNIVAGTLDIDLVDKDGKSLVGEGKSIGFVDEDGNALSNILWEPGCRYQLQEVKLVNKGNLHAKYTVVISATVGDVDLANVIDVYEGETKLGTLRSFLDKSEGIKHGVIAPKEELAFGTLTLVMQENAGNEYQGKSITNITVTVLATQAAVESDSFDNTYDANAKFPEEVVKALDKDAETVIKGINITATVPANAGLQAEGIDIVDGALLHLVYEPTKLNSNISVAIDEKAETYEVSLETADGKKVVSAVPIAVEMKIGEGHEGNVRLYHNETLIDSAYDASTGTITYETTGFSPFTVVYEKPIINITYKTDAGITVGTLSYDPDADNSNVFSELKIYENFIAVEEFKDFTDKVASGGNGKQLVGMPYYYCFSDVEGVATKVSYGNETFFYADKEFTTPATIPTKAGDYTVYCKFANHFLDWFCFPDPLMIEPDSLGATYVHTVKNSSLGTYMSMGMGSQAVGTPANGWTVVAEMKDGNGEWISVPAEAVNNNYWEPKFDLTKLGTTGDTVTLRIVDLYCAVCDADGNVMYYSHVEKIPTGTEFVLTIG